jgi:hypothetical protein
VYDLVGVSLGSNQNEILVSTNILRHVEFDSVKVVPKVSNVSDISLLDKEEANPTRDGQLLSSLVRVGS